MNPETLPQDPGRRRFLTRALWLTGGLLALSACGRQESKSALKDWRRQPAERRLKILESGGLDPKTYPEIPQLEPRQELVLAAAEVYCRKTQCRLKFSTLADKVSFLDSAEFLAALGKEPGRELSSKEREKDARTLEFVTSSDRRVLMNWPAIQREIDVRREELKQPASAVEYFRQDLEAVTVKSLLFHAFTHVNSFHDELVLDGQDQFGLAVTVTHEGKSETDYYDFRRRRGFRLAGRTKDGRWRIIEGADEAAADLIAREIASRGQGLYISSGQRYREGAELIGFINHWAKVDIDEFIAYYSGRQPMDGLFVKWGALKDRNNPDKRAAILALAIVGLFADGLIGQQEARRLIDETLKRQDGPDKPGFISG